MTFSSTHVIEQALSRIATALERIATTYENNQIPAPKKKQLLLDNEALSKILSEAKIDTEHD